MPKEKHVGGVAGLKKVCDEMNQERGIPSCDWCDGNQKEWTIPSFERKFEDRTLTAFELQNFQEFWDEVKKDVPADYRQRIDDRIEQQLSIQSRKQS